MEFVEVNFINYEQRNTFGGKAYEFVTYFEIKKGDLLVVEANHSYHVVKAVGDSYPISKINATKYVVTKIDLKEFEQQKQKTEEKRELLQSIKLKIKELEKEKELETKVKELNDPELNDLFEKLSI